MKEAREIASVVFKAVALAMGVAVMVLSVMDAVSVESSVLLLGIGLFCFFIRRASETAELVTQISGCWKGQSPCNSTPLVAED